MIINQNPHAARHRGNHTSNNSATPILLQSSAKRQLALKISVRGQRLTESLETLESAGYSEEVALIILAETQACWECDQ